MNICTLINRSLHNKSSAESFGATHVAVWHFICMICCSDHPFFFEPSHIIRSTVAQAHTRKQAHTQSINLPSEWLRSMRPGSSVHIHASGRGAPDVLIKKSDSRLFIQASFISVNMCHTDRPVCYQLQFKQTLKCESCRPTSHCSWL